MEIENKIFAGDCLDIPNRKYAGCETNPAYVEMAERGIAEINPLFEQAAY